MSPDMVPQLVEVTLAGGAGYVIKAMWDFFAKRQEAKTPESRQTFQLSQTTSQVDILARVNAELESDNDRLRTVLRETEDRHAAERQAWQSERREMQAEADALRAKAIELMSEIESLQHKLRRFAEDDPLHARSEPA